MGAATPMIRSVDAREYGRVLIEATDGKRYEADLTPMSSVYCFPRDLTEWRKVSIDSHALGLVWENRFEVHADQIIGLAVRVEPISIEHAAG